jgi:hypothetical protein
LREARPGFLSLEGVLRRVIRRGGARGQLRMSSAVLHRDLGAGFTLAFRVATFARSIAYMRQRAALPPEARPPFETDFAILLERALARTLG